MNGNSEEAADLFRREYEQTRDQGALFNLGIALLDLGRIDQTLSVFQQLKNLLSQENTTSESVCIYLGLAEWFAGKSNEAIGFWTESLDAKYTDEAGGVGGSAVLWYAGIRMQDEKIQKQALKKLKRLWKPKVLGMKNTWPGPTAIAGYVLGEVDDAVFLNSWKSENSILEIRRQCRVNFWMGIKSKDHSKSHSHFRQALVNRSAILEFEYFLAKWETSDFEASPSIFQ